MLNLMFMIGQKFSVLQPFKLLNVSFEVLCGLSNYWRTPAKRVCEGCIRPSQVQ